MTLSGRKAWVVLGAALLAGGVGGSFLGRTSRPATPIEIAADAGVAVHVDAGVLAACECVQDVRWKTIEVPVPRTVYVHSDAGLIEIQRVQTVPILVPDLHLTGSSEARAELEALADAHAAAAGHQDAPKMDADRRWEVGGLFLHGFSGTNLAGPVVGVNLGGVGVRIVGAGGEKPGAGFEGFLGAAVVGRF